ncbi:MAG: riboflavin synthase, partial [Dehalococcoidia bacterium]|nr:riboflavin synthase [Dehalococcoidia bacterium]
VEMDESSFRANLMAETYRRSSLGALPVGSRVNLEPAVLAGERLGGHIVQGHIDGVGTVAGSVRAGDDLILDVSAPADLTPYIVEKGSISVDGVSLTVVERDDESFSVSLVTFTQGNTNLGDRKVGDPVNLEVDVIAKYVEQLLRPYLARVST